MPYFTFLISTMILKYVNINFFRNSVTVPHSPSEYRHPSTAVARSPHTSLLSFPLSKLSSEDKITRPAITGS